MRALKKFTRTSKSAHTFKTPLYHIHIMGCIQFRAKLQNWSIGCLFVAADAAVDIIIIGRFKRNFMRI